MEERIVICKKSFEDSGYVLTNAPLSVIEDAIAELQNAIEEDGVTSEQEFDFVKSIVVQEGYTFKMHPELEEVWWD